MARLPRILPLVAIAIGGVVVVRAIGVAPGLFEGARAWAEEAVPAAAAEGAAAPRAAPAVCALSPEQLAQQAGLSPAELRVIQSLKDRRAELDVRDHDFATMLPLMAAAEQKLDAKTQALTTLRGELQALLGQVGEREQAEIDRLVAVYSAMRPKEAARVFATLDDRVRLPVAAAMRPRSLAAVMAQMEPSGARDLTEKLARRFERQQAAAQAAVAAAANPEAPAPAPEPAPAPTETAATPTAGEGAEAAAPRPRPTARTPQRRPAARPAAARPAPQQAAAEAPGPQPYSGGADGASRAPGAQPRQTVQ